jgi:DNA-binding NtrC family response regulator
MHVSSSELSAYQIEGVRRFVGRPIAAVERELIIETLIDQRGSRTEAAKLLGISLRTCGTRSANTTSME